MAHIDRARRRHRIHPHVETDVVGLHRIIGGALVVPGIGVPFLDKRHAFRRIGEFEGVQAAR